MEEGNYKLAGWAALGSAVTFLVTSGILIYDDVLNTPALKGGRSDLETLLLALSIDVISTALGIYALLKFRQLLRERYDFHAVDNLILILIFAGLIMSAVAYTGRLFGMNRPAAGPNFSGALPFVFILAFVGIAVGVLGIIFALRLLKLPGTLNGYLKPLAYTELIGSVCFMLVFLAPIGLIMMVVFNVLLGLVFLNSDDSLEEVDFV